MQIDFDSFNNIYTYIIGPPIRQEDPLNLSILISGGKETNQDSLSNGEWSGNSSDWKPLSGIVVWRSSVNISSRLSPLEQGAWEGDSPVFTRYFFGVYDELSTSRVAWDCSSKWVVNSI